MKRRRPKTRAQRRYERESRKARYGPHWNEIRKKVYARDGYKCRACGAKNTKLNAHHILLLRVSKTNDERNLVTLCDSCHKIVEEKGLKLLKSGAHRSDVVRMTHRWIMEMNAKYKDGELITE
jgi:5-methylcytosine-specific restriction endonuclease McrA